VTKTKTDTEQSESETLAEIADRHAPSPELLARREREAQAEIRDLDDNDPYLQARRPGHTVVGYPVRIGRRDKPEPPKGRVPREVPMPPERYGVGALLEILRHLGIPVPDGVVELFDRTLDLRARLRTEPDEIADAMVIEDSPSVEQFRADVAAALADGAITKEQATAQLARAGADSRAQARKAVRTGLVAAALDAYREAWGLIAGTAGLRIYDALNTVAIDAIRTQTDSAKPLADQQQRWDLAHQAGAMLRGWAVDDLPSADRLDWQLARPDLAHVWRVNRSEDATIYARRPIPHTRWTVALHHFPPRHDTREVVGPETIRDRERRAELSRYPNLHDISQHPEWGAGVRNAAEVHQTLSTIAKAQAQW
jgi:hypothetical protein